MFAFRWAGLVAGLAVHCVGVAVTQCWVAVVLPWPALGLEAFRGLELLPVPR